MKNIIQKPPQLLPTEYAGFRDEVIAFLKVEIKNVQRKSRRPLLLFDPMSGTAPLLPFVEENHYFARFNDLLPLHLHINASKRLAISKTYSRLGEARCRAEFMRCLRPTAKASPIPTTEWFDTECLNALIESWHLISERPSPLMVLLRSLLLLSLRDFASFSRTKNPTWTRPGGYRRQVSLDEIYEKGINLLKRYWEFAYDNSNRKGGKIYLTNRDASTIKLGQKADIIFTSPPYCNRVEWQRLYGPEYNFLSNLKSSKQNKEFIGTPKVKNYSSFNFDSKYVTANSQYAKKVLDQVAVTQINSERTSNYYVKYFTKYFADLFRVFEASLRNLNPRSGRLYFGVQNNSHRGQDILIGKALSELLKKNDFQSELLQDWDRHHLGLQNVSRKHRAINRHQKEELWLARRY